MPKINIQHILSFLLVSIGTMTTMTFGFVPVVNILEAYSTVIYSLLFWAPFGCSALVFGYFIDKRKNKKYGCFSFVIWGILVISLNFVIGNELLMIFFIFLIGIFTGLNVIIGTSYMGSNIQINRRGFYGGTFLGIGWGIVGITAYISYLNLFINLFILGMMNISAGLISFLLIQTGKVDLNWEKIVVIPKNFNVKNNAMIFWFSSLVFGLFMGVIVFLLGTTWDIDVSLSSLYLENVKYYLTLAEEANLGLVNFDFIAMGAFNFLFSIIFGKLIDKYGRKPIFFLANMLIPSVLILFMFWQTFVLMFVSVAFYAAVTAIYIVMNCAVWSDLAPKDKVGRYIGYGWSSIALGGAFGFVVGYIITSPELLTHLDTMIIMSIIGISELSLIPFVFMKDSLPPAEEMDWPNQVVQLYVITDGGIMMTHYAFKSKVTFDLDLFSGGISGVTTILQEMIESDQKLKVIDHEDKKLLFEYGDRFVVTLIARKDLRIIRSKLKILSEEIQNVFWEILEDWNGDLDVFKPINTLIKNLFEESDRVQKLEDNNANDSA